MSRTREYAETIIDLIENRNDTQILGRIVLGGGEGPGGGSGLPWRTPIGQLNQRLVTYDTTEAALATTSEVTSLVDNLNHIRDWLSPSRQFQLTSETPRSLRVHVANGVWYYQENAYLDYPGGYSAQLVLPSSNPRLDLVYITASGVINTTMGTEAVSPIAPTVDMLVSDEYRLPLGLVYLQPAATAIGANINELPTYGAYIYKDLRPFLSMAGGAGTIVSPSVYNSTTQEITAYTTIQAAIDASSAGDYVLIPPGIYDESITLKANVIITEVFSGTVIVNSTAATAVTTVTNGYIRVKEICCTRANDDITAVVSAHTTGECTIVADLILAENSGTGATYGTRKTGAGILHLYVHNGKTSGGDSDVSPLEVEGGVVYAHGDFLCENSVDWGSGVTVDDAELYVWGDCKATGGDAIAGAGCWNGGTLIVHGDCIAITDTEDSYAAGLSTGSSGQVEVYGNCVGEGDIDVYGADLYNSAGTEYIRGNCIAICADGAGGSYGVQSKAAGNVAVDGNCTAVGGTESIGAYLKSWGGGEETLDINGDVTGDDYGAACEAGTLTITGGTATGATFDLIQTGGILEVINVNYTTTSGTIINGEFHPRRLVQGTEPSSGVGATEIRVGELLIWNDSDDATVHLLYNDAITGVVEIGLT